jgi:hypothetical protein
LRCQGRVQLHVKTKPVPDAAFLWRRLALSRSLQAKGRKAAKVGYPRVIVTQGEAPPQYLDPDDLDADAPTWGINLVTGEKITFGGRK